MAVPAEHRLAFLDGEPVGVMSAECDPESREAFVELSAVGDRREEVLAFLLAAARDFALRYAARDPRSVPSDKDPFALSAEFWQMPTVQREGDDACAGAFKAAGLRVIRTFWTMTWDISQGVPEPIAPQGVSRRSLTTDQDFRIIHAIEQAAFADHFGFLHEDPFDHWMDLASSRPGFTPDRLWIAELNGKPVGICLLDDSRRELNEEYVGVLAVLREARGRGIAKWLLQSVACDAAARGVPAVTLNCDSENTTNATALYESVGFRVRNQANLWNEPVVVDA
jgi:ribosomal protein S18 acetylase RimI-like enzyme